LYGLQQSLEAEEERERPRDEPTGPNASKEMTTLRMLLAGKRFELSNWHYDAPQIPHAPGVLLLYDTPFRLLWAEGVDDLHDTLAQHVKGEPSDFASAFLQQIVLPILGSRQIEHLKEGKLTIQSVVSFRVAQLVSYRFCVFPHSALR